MSDLPTKSQQCVQMDAAIEPSVTAVPEDTALEAAGAVEAPSRTASVVAEAKRYRKRAQAAEQTLQELRNALAAREQTITEHQQTIARLEQRQTIDAALLEAGALDLEAARALAESALSTMDKPDVSQAVAELRQGKPFLFRAAPRQAGAGVMSPKSTAAQSPQAKSIDRAAAEAVASGHRRDLLRYLRLRRAM